MLPWLMVSIVIVFQIIVVADLSLKAREIGFCSVARLFRVSESGGQQPKSVPGLS